MYWVVHPLRPRDFRGSSYILKDILRAKRNLKVRGEAQLHIVRPQYILTWLSQCTTINTTSLWIYQQTHPMMMECRIPTLSNWISVSLPLLNLTKENNYDAFGHDQDHLGMPLATSLAAFLHNIDNIEEDGWLKLASCCVQIESRVTKVEPVYCLIFATQ